MQNYPIPMGSYYAECCKQMQNRQRVIEFAETYLTFLKQVSNKTPLLGVLAYILSTCKKRNRLKSMILSGYENNAIAFC
jgi:hypothetical protein